MQTFLPYPDITKSVQCLDWKRLGNQRVEAKHILDILRKQRHPGRWKYHPAVKMWNKHINALALYMNACIQHWIERGYNNTMIPHRIRGHISMPSWFGNPAFHASHRSNLLRKNPEWYGQFGWKEPDDMKYVWPYV